MRPTYLSLMILFFLLVVAGAPVLAQPKTPISVCRPDVYAALRPLPKLVYDCPEDLNDSDDKLLKLPARRAAVDELVEKLQTFNDARWWQASVDALNVCDFRGSAGSLTVEEKAKLHSGDYLFQLFGNQQLRLVLVSDPCYQRGYNGSIAFLLNRNRGKVVVSRLLDGYYSRVDNSVGVAFALQSGEQIIEVETANSMPPGLTYYYFRIDRNTGKAMPKNLFRDGKKLSNEIYSAMLFGKPDDFGLPKDAGELDVIRGTRLAQTFSAYEDIEGRGIDDNGRKLRRIVYRWNGRFYTAVR
ncbi:MAG TPA: hypothetical protein VK208_02200 [Pyrinomonadaceae bacterium]|nr:hypothetical protein [Pyrinomonadaceae bacterium]